MTELPVVIEAGLWLNVVFGAILIAVGGLIGRAIIVKGSSAPISAVASGVFLCVAALGLGVAILVQNIDWQLRLENRGVVLRAPFDLLRPSAEIAWSNIDQISVSARRSYRNTLTFDLIVNAKTGTRIDIVNAEEFPVAFGPLMQKIVTERAPQAKGHDKLADEFAYARAHASVTITAPYSARNAHGDRLP
jgi:hypothetical protein